MLMSFPGSVEAAAPFAGAAHPSKGARHTESAGDFADLMRGAEASPQDASGAEDGGDNAAVAEPATGVAEVASNDVKADAKAETTTTEDSTPITFQTPNLAGFFRSMRSQDAVAGQTKASVPSSVAEAIAPVTKTAAAEDTAIPPTIIVDIAVPFRAVTPTDIAAPNPDTPVTTDLLAEDTLVPAAITLATPDVIESAAVQTATALVADTAAQIVTVPETPVMAEAFAAVLGAESASADPLTSRPMSAVEHEIENASERVPGEPYVLAAMSPNAQAAVAALRQVTAQPTAESAPVPVSPVTAVATTAAPTTTTPTPTAMPATAVPTTAAAPTTPTASVPAAAVDEASPASTPAKMVPSGVAPHAAAKAYTATPSAFSAEPAARLKVAAPAADAALAPAPRVDRPAMAAHVLSSVFVPHLSSAAPAVTAAAVTSKEALTAAVESQMSDQIVQSLKMQFDQGGGEAKIELNPTYLGRVQVSVRVSQGTVSASVQADTPVVREWIASNRAELTHTLSQQGLKLDKLEVAETPKEEQARDNGRDQRQSQREPTRPRRDDRGQSVDTFEIQDSQEIA